MPRDFNGASAPRLSLQAQRLNTLKLIRSRQLGQDRKQRRVTEKRMQLAEWLLGKVIDGTDVIGEGSLEQSGGVETVFLLVAIDRFHFNNICSIGGDLSDLEDTNDAEPNTGDHEPDDDDEPSLGSPDRVVNQERWAKRTIPIDHAGNWNSFDDFELDLADREPSLGSSPALDQRDWSKGGRSDRENDGDDREPQ